MVFSRKFVGVVVTILAKSSRLLGVESKRKTLRPILKILLQQTSRNRINVRSSKSVAKTAFASIKTKMSGVVEMGTQSENVELEEGDDTVKKVNPEDVTKHSVIDDTSHVEGGENSNLKSSAGERTKWHKQKKRKSKQQLHMSFKKARLTSDEAMSQTEYYFENGLRKVIPYDHNYNTFCKGRWVGKTLGELYTSEFRLHPIEFYDKAIREGRLLVNLEPARSLGQTVGENDLLTSMVHRHECPVSDAPIEVVADTEDFFVVNKPCSIPIHPAGRFRHNCLISIMAKEMNVVGLHGIHRLDRMTSGLCIFTKKKEISRKCHAHIRDRLVEKEYVCRVIGDFTKFSLPENHDHRIESDGKETTVNEAIQVYDLKMGTSIVSRSEAAKDSITVFKCLSTNGETSVLSCKPKTGRTHQIRVHLQYLGFPIVNDPMYNSPAWGDERFQLGPVTKPMDEVMHELADMKKWSAVREEVKKMLKEDAEAGDAKLVEIKKAKSEPPEQSQALKKALTSREGIVPYRPECEECKHPLSDPKPSELAMFLHALRYKGPDWRFETTLPGWASPDWTPCPKPNT